MPKGKAAGPKKGLSAKTFSGLNKKRMEKKAGGVRVPLRQGATIPIQFLQKPEQFMEYEVHSFQEDGRWEFVPCAGDDVCPLCQEDDDRRNRANYRFCCNVYNLESKKVQILEGPKDLAGRIIYRYERKPNSFLKKVFEVTKFATTPVSYALDLADEAPIDPKGLKLLPLEKYLADEMKRYYGEEMPETDALEDDDEEETPKPKATKGKGKAAVEDDDDEDEDEDDEEDEDDDDLDDDDDDDDLDDLDDEDEDEDEEEEDEDEEDEEDEPPAKSKAKSKASTKKRR